jgi:RNA polymerase sigma factor for flagellar operon FliA
MKTKKRDRIVLEHLPLVKAIAMRVHENLPVHVDLDDLIHAGILGLFDAAGKFDSTKKVAFSSYAKHRIKGAILDSLRQLDWASRDLRRRHKQVEAARAELGALLQRTPTEQEIAQKLGMDLDEFRKKMVGLRGLISASTRSEANDELPAPDFPTHPSAWPDTICAEQELRDMLPGALNTLKPRYRTLMELYYRDELSMEEIGKRLGVNCSRISQMHKFALSQLRENLESHGVTSVKAFVASA